MTSGGSWIVKGFRSEARAAERAGTDTAGDSVGDWLNSVVEPENPTAPPPLAGSDRQNPPKKRLPPPRPEPGRPVRDQQSWWRRWRAEGSADAKAAPRRESRPTRPPAVPPAVRETTNAQPGPRGGAAPDRRRPVEQSQEPVADLHSRLNELSQQIQRLANKHAGLPEGTPRRPLGGAETAPQLGGAPRMRPPRPARPASGPDAGHRDQSVYGAASIDDVVAEIMARQRVLDGEPPLPDDVRKDTANVAIKPDQRSRPAADAAPAQLPVPDLSPREADWAEPVAAPAIPNRGPLLPDVAFDMGHTSEPATDQPVAVARSGDSIAAGETTTGAAAQPVPMLKTMVSEIPANRFDARPHQDDHTPEPEVRGAADASTIQSTSTVAFATAAYLRGLEQHLREITSRIEALRPSEELERAVEGLRADLAEISRLITEALPRHAIESLDTELKALGERIHQSRQSGVDADALAALERGLNEVREALLALTPAENLVGFQDAVQALTQKVDLIVAKDDPETLQQLEAAIGGLRGIVSHVASTETLTKVAEDVRALSEKVDSLANIAANGPDLSGLENRIDVLADAVSASTEAGQAVPRELEKLLSGLIEKLQWVQVTHADHAAMAQLEDRVGRLVQRCDDSEARLAQLDTVERGLADVMAHVEGFRGSATGVATPAGPATAWDVADIRETELRTQDSLETVQSTVEHVVDRLAMIEINLRGDPSHAMPPPLPIPAPELEAPAIVPEPDQHIVPAMDEAAAPVEGLSSRPLPVPARKPLDPSLPPDHPLEPGSANGRAPARMSAAERIAASEALAPPAKPPVIDDPGGKSNFIAAARRAALAAAETPYAPASGAKPSKSAAAGKAAARKFPLPRPRTLIIAAVAALIIVGGLQIASKWFEPRAGAPLRVTPPEQTVPSDTTPADTAPPDTTPAQPQPRMPTPPAASLPVPSTAPTAPETAPLATPPSPPPSPNSSTLPDTKPSAPSAPTEGSGGTAPSAAPQPAAAPSALPQPAAAPPSAVGGPNAPGAPQAATPLSIVPASTTAVPADKLPTTITPALRAAVLSGDAAAAYEVALRFADGRGVAQSNDAAAFWLSRAAKQGLAPAEFRLGGMYEKGIGVKKDLATARGLYMAAAEKGNGKAMHNLAVLYAEGIDGAPDYRNAAFWFRKAADHGIVDSQYNLAILYARGVGVEQNFAESYKWFALAGQLGDKDADKKSEEIAAHLDAQTLAAAKLAVKNWTAEPQPEDAITVKTPPEWNASAAASPSTPKLRPTRAKPAPAEPKIN